MTQTMNPTEPLMTEPTSETTASVWAEIARAATTAEQLVCVGNAEENANVTCEVEQFSEAWYGLCISAYEFLMDTGAYADQVTQTEMDELHEQALATDLLRSRVLEDDDRLLGVLLEQPDALNAYLSARAIRNELHSRAAEMDRNRAVVLEQASDGVLRHLMDTTSEGELEARGLTVESLWNELYGRNKAQPGTPKVVCAVVCGITGTEDCPTDPETQRRCPTC